MRLFWIISSVVIVVALAWVAAVKYLTLEDVKVVAKAAIEVKEDYYWFVLLALFFGNVLGMAFSLPSKAVLTLLAGALLGPLIGGIVTILGVLSGTTVLFFATRHLLQKVISRRLGKRALFIDQRVFARPIRSIIGLRLFIALPFGPITMAAALSSMRYRDFFVGTIIGDIPVTFAYTIAAERLFALTLVSEALSPSTAAILIVVGLFILTSSFLGKRQRKTTLSGDDA
jgi:uncharacterized membrane protein YdjX (TVP38/TMEM64 family)